MPRRSVSWIHICTSCTCTATGCWVRSPTPTMRCRNRENGSTALRSGVAAHLAVSHPPPVPERDPHSKRPGTGEPSRRSTPGPADHNDVTWRTVPHTRTRLRHRSVSWRHRRVQRLRAPSGGAAAVRRGRLLRRRPCAMGNQPNSVKGAFSGRGAVCRRAAIHDLARQFDAGAGPGATLRHRATPHVDGVVALLTDDALAGDASGSHNTGTSTDRASSSAPTAWRRRSDPLPCARAKDGELPTGVLLLQRPTAHVTPASVMVLTITPDRDLGLTNFLDPRLPRSLEARIARNPVLNPGQGQIGQVILQRTGRPSLLLQAASTSMSMGTLRVRCRTRRTACAPARRAGRASRAPAQHVDLDPCAEASAHLVRQLEDVEQVDVALDRRLDLGQVPPLAAAMLASPAVRGMRVSVEDEFHRRHATIAADEHRGMVGVETCTCSCARSCIAPWKPWIVDWLCTPPTQRFTAPEPELGELRHGLHGVDRGEEGCRVDPVADWSMPPLCSNSTHGLPRPQSSSTEAVALDVGEHDARPDALGDGDRLVDQRPHLRTRGAGATATLGEEHQLTPGTPGSFAAGWQRPPARRTPRPAPTSPTANAAWASTWSNGRPGIRATDGDAAGVRSGDGQDVRGDRRLPVDLGGLRQVAHGYRPRIDLADREALVAQHVERRGHRRRCPLRACRRQRAPVPGVGRATGAARTARAAPRHEPAGGGWPRSPTRRRRGRRRSPSTRHGLGGDRSARARSPSR